MKTWKLAAGIVVVTCLVGWRLHAAVGNLDPQVYGEILQAAPRLALWVRASFVVMVVGFLIVAGYAIKNESDADADRQEKWTDMRQHVEKELMASITRSVRSSMREREEELDEWQGKLETVDKELNERYQIVAAREQAVEARGREVDEAKAEVMPLCYAYEDGRATLDSLIEVARDDQADTIKILTTGLAWVKLAVEDPEKFIMEAKAERVNSGWIERLQRKLEDIEVRVDGTEQEAEQLHERVATQERQRRKEVAL